MDAFEVLGLGRQATEREVRTAFRRRALREHPDRRPDDPHASERFKRLVQAYEDALALSRGEIPRSRQRARPKKDSGPPPPPIRERYACTGCNDTYPIDDRCPRCDLPLVDSWQSVEHPAPPVDPRVEQLIAALELGPRFTIPDMPIPEGARPWLAVAAFLGFGMLTTQVGLVALGGMLGAFALFVAGIELHDRATRPAKVRTFVF